MKLTLQIVVVVVFSIAMLMTSLPASSQAVIKRGDVPGVKLGQDQRDQVYSIRQQTRREIRQIMNDPKLTEEQKDSRITQAIEQNHQRVLAILTPEQRRQYEAWWQMHVEEPLMKRTAGAGAGPSQSLLFRVPGVDPASLTDAQKNRIAEIRLNTIERVSEIDTNPNLSEDQKMSQIEQARFQGHSQVMAVLTPEQRQQFANWWDAK